MTQPRSYEELSHPLTKVSEDTRVTETYYLSNPQADSSSTQVLLVAPESSEPGLLVILWTWVSSTNRISGSSGIVIVLGSVGGGSSSSTR